MALELPNILYDKIDGIPTIDSYDSLYSIPMYKPEEYFDNYESRNFFIKNCEKLIRTNDRYNKYISYIKKIIGLNHCAVLSNISGDDLDNEKTGIEMHHGPILTLYDYVDIAIEYALLKKWNISTFKIANYVLDEHYENHVQVVMLSSTVHQEITDRSIFLNYKHGFGDISAFLYKHWPAVTPELKEKIDRYIDRSILQDSNDYGILELSKTIYRLN